ncbi:MAG: hypothetical protein ACFB16_02935 [Phormidesmis sp.]
MVTTSDSSKQSSDSSASANGSTVEAQPIKLLRTRESEKLERIRHTLSHVMAMAVQRLYPTAQVTIGPSSDYG